MPASTLRSERPLHDRLRDAVEAAVSESGGSVVWRVHAAGGRTYGLVELPAGARSVASVVSEPLTVFETPIIALAVSPSVAEAIPAVLEAFAGPGRPEGVIACVAASNAVILEWDPARTAAATIFALLDVELARFAAGRTTELLSPLPDDVVAQIAAAGLSTPEIASGRILERLLDERMGIA